MIDLLGSFLTVFLGSGASFAALRLFFDKEKEERERSDAIKYLVLQLAFQFEGFAIECGTKASANRMADENNGDAGRSILAVPQPQPMPTSDAYRFLEADILNRVFAFPQRCQMAQEASRLWLDAITDTECYTNAVEEHTIVMGGEALEIASVVSHK